jgi:predicted acylesterase/phospholipase RssA
VGIQDVHRGAPSNVFQVMTRAVSAAQKHQLEVWERHADLVLRPDVQALAWDDFDRAEEAIEAGGAVARLALPRIEKYLERAATAAATAAVAVRDRQETDEVQNHLLLTEALR